ncbi:DUF4131 domain-containing protein, partial [bacterium]|nr:DUF4131 domain-containing protein [bacterium]
MAGAVFGWSPLWAVCFSGLAFATARPTFRWWIGIGAVTLVVAWRSQVMESPVRASLASSSSEFVEGVLTVGRKSSPAQAERFGVLDEDGVKRRVVILEADEYQPGEVRRISGRFFVPSRERNPGLFPQIDFWERQGIYGGLWVEQSELESVKWSSAPYRWSEGLRERLLVLI